ncbi:unnamed protein product [Adineta ricciae]|uniref:Uncharacterized protein n=1 Tax=Adineta ricciae TaxID=249248 RepID=A0A815UU63_ADIRI|nr:unnamed protein product [Adineta ricciae]
MMPYYYHHQQHQYPMNLPMNGLYPPANNYYGMGGFVNGHGMPLTSPPPPFYYPYDMSSMVTAGSYTPRSTRKNQGPYRKNKNNAPRTPSRSAQKSKKQKRNTPTDRRLVHFMPDSLMQSTNQGNQMNSSNKSVNQQGRSKKSPEKAHRDTLSRRDRRRKSRAAVAAATVGNTSPTQNKTVPTTTHNRFLLLSDSDDEEEENDKSVTETESTEYSEVEKTMNKRNAKTRDTKQKNHILSKTPKDDLTSEMSSAKSKDKRKQKLYLQDFKLFSYVRERVNKTRAKNEVNLKDHLNTIFAYAKDTIEMYEETPLG